MFIKDPNSQTPSRWNHLGHTLSDTTLFFAGSFAATKTPLVTWISAPLSLSQFGLSSVASSIGAQVSQLLFGSSPEASFKKIFTDAMGCSFGSWTCPQLWKAFFSHYAGLITPLHSLALLAACQGALKTALSSLKSVSVYGKTHYEALYYQNHPKEFKTLSPKHQLTILEHLRVLTK